MKRVVAMGATPPNPRSGLLAALALVAIAPAAARADDTTAARNAAAARELQRPHTLAEVNTGFLLLPGALVCPTTLDPAACKRGEFSFAVGLQNVYRFGRFGFGAGIQWATTLRSDAANGDPSLMREHSRSYFLVEALFRYYFIRLRNWDWWAGANTGAVVINDSWTVNTDRSPYADTAFVGPRAATLGTEGFTLGGSIGGEWTFLTNWSLGPTLRYSSWFLPSTPAMSPTKDVASLSGRLDMFDIGVRVAYRIAL